MREVVVTLSKQHEDALMGGQVVVQGTLKPDGTLELDEKPNLPPGRVQLVMVPLPELPKDDPFWQRMQAIWDAQRARGHVPRSEAEVEAERQALREEWEERMERIDRIQAEAEQVRKARRPGA
jgi:hypothetical protein